MIKIKKTGYLIIISGPSGAGKGTICSELLKRNKNLVESISMTTRAPRGAEVEGVDYYYVDREFFEEKIKENYFLEYAIVHSNEYYGTPKQTVLDKLDSGLSVILEIDIQGAIKIKDQIEGALYIFILPPSMEELKADSLKEEQNQKKKYYQDLKKHIKKLMK